MVAGLHRHSALRIATGLALALTLGACKGKEEKGTPLGAPQENATRAAMPTAGREALDAGNEAFRLKKYDEALAKYRQAAKEIPGSSAPWFGVYMVATKLNDKALADSAQAEINKITPNAPLADSQLQQMHQQAAQGAAPGALPAGHPAMPKSE